MSCPSDGGWKDKLLDFLWEYHPKKLADIVAALGLTAASPDEVAKNYGAWVIDALLSAAGAGYGTDALNSRGISVKTVRMPADGRPYESMSFPAFDHADLASEEWESSALRGDLSCLLIITLYGRDRSTPLAECTLGHGFFWHPDDEEESLIRDEWTIVRDRIRQGRMRDIPTEANTKAIHVRPHGRDSADVVPDVRGHEVVRSSLWLNKDFVLKIVRANV